MSEYSFVLPEPLPAVERPLESASPRTRMSSRGC